MNSEGTQTYIYIYPFSLKAFGWWICEQQPVGRGGVRGRREGDTSSFWPGYSTGPDLLDFVGNTSQLRNPLCIANMTLTVYHFFIFSVASPWLSPSLSASAVLLPDVSFLSVSLIVWMLLPFAFCWLCSDYFSMTRSEKEWSQSLSWGASSSRPQANLFLCILISKMEIIEVMHHRQGK